MSFTLSFTPKFSLAAACALLIPCLALCTPISSGSTIIVLDRSTIEGIQFNIYIGPLAPAGLGVSGSNDALAFPIVGGDTTTGLIDHLGGIEWTGNPSARTGNGTIFDTENFIFNLNSDVVTGEATVNGGLPSTLPLFDVSGPNFLLIDSGLASELSMLYGIGNISDEIFGTFTISPVLMATPEPMSFTLLIAGLLATGLFLRRKLQ